MSKPSISCLKKLRNLEKSREEGDADDDSSSISRLPDEIILQILHKIIDLKSLCCCYLVSKRFSSIVVQVEAISFTAPLLNPNAIDDVNPSMLFPPKRSSNCSESFLSATSFLTKFKRVKSLCIECLSSSDRAGAIVNRYSFKWKVNFGTVVESFLFLSPNSICDKDGFYLCGNGDEGGEEEDLGLTNDLNKQKFDISMECLRNAIVWHLILLYFVKNLPMLEKVSITDSGRRGRLSLSGGILGEVKEWVDSVSKTEFNRVEVPDRVSRCYIPVLRLPVSGYVMKGVFCAVVERHDLQGGNDGLINSEDGFEGKQGAAFKEAVREILEKNMMHTWTVLKY